jgi:type IV pilus assembly protein PilQ
MANTLQNISYSGLPGNAVQVTLELAEPASEPMVFTIDNPARIALDLVDTTNTLANKSDNIGVGVVNSYSSAEAKGRTRVVLNLTQMSPYEAKADGNTIVITMGGTKKQTIDTFSSPVVSGTTTDDKQIRNVDFRRGEQGEGLIQVTLPSAKTSVDMRQEGDKLVIDFISANVPPSLQRKLDVKDFATPVYEIATFNQGNNARMEVKLDVENEHLAYQSNEDFIIEVKPLSVAQEEAAKRKGDEYVGEKLSLNFQDIEVRSVLQLLADFTGLNVVVSDTVGGNLTLRLKNVPWDQALDIILRTKGLAQRQTGNVVLIAPAAEIANAERLELEAAQQVRELEPLTSEFIPINYADAADISGIISSESTTVLSPRGSVTVDPRTNTLLVRETASHLAEIRALIAELDIPIKQVLIESRIVSATDDFSKSLGVRFGFGKKGVVRGRKGEEPFDPANENKSYAIGGTQPNTTASTFETGGVDDLLVDLPSAIGGGSLGLAVGKIGSYLLQLELSAMQAEGRGEIISSPRLVTSDKNEASIETGVQIPYQEASSSGATTTAFEDAVLSLGVTPQITPDDRVIMDLEVSKDAPSTTTVNGVPAVNTQNVTTQVIVDNGETVVLGGVYERSTSEAVQRVPFFSDLPYVGWAFRNKLSSDNKSELLIFVTPRILKEESQLN